MTPLRAARRITIEDVVDYFDEKGNTKKEAHNNAGQHLQDANNQIQKDTHLIKTLAEKPGKAEIIVLNHILAQLPDHLGKHAALIRQANETIREKDFEGMAAKLAKLPAKESKELVLHVQRKTLEITRALENMRTYKVQFKIGAKMHTADSTKQSSLNDEAIKINHAFTIAHYLNK